MYTSVVGNTFLTEYNRRNNLNYSAKDFFEKELFELIFNHEKYLMWASNSPFVQGISKKKPFFEAAERLENLEKFHEKISSGEKDGSIALGFPASENKEFATTSGMVTDIDIPVDQNEIYASWIGAALSLGVAGGYTILFDDPEITYATFEGWKHYRRFLNDPLLEKLPPNKLTSWNGQWITYRFGKWYSPDFNFNTLIDEKAIAKKDNEFEISTVDWARLFFSLSKTIKNDLLTAYIFSLGSTNKTVGFIPFQFKSGRRLLEVYQKLFGNDNFQISANEFETLFGRHIKRACELGSIGIQALQPKLLIKYFDASANLKFASSKTKPKEGESKDVFQQHREKELAKDRENIISYQTFKTWLVAMLSKNKTEISDYSRDIARALIKYRMSGRKNDRKNLIEKDFFKTSKNEMLKALDKIVSDSTVELEIADKMNSLRDQLHFMSKEDFTYFVLLLKFDYAYAEREFDNQ